MSTSCKMSLNDKNSRTTQTSHLFAIDAREANATTISQFYGLPLKTLGKTNFWAWIYQKSSPGSCVTLKILYGLFFPQLWARAHRNDVISLIRTTRKWETCVFRQLTAVVPECPNKLVPFGRQDVEKLCDNGHRIFYVDHRRVTMHIVKLRAHFEWKLKIPRNWRRNMLQWHTITFWHPVLHIHPNIVARFYLLAKDQEPFPWWILFSNVLEEFRIVVYYYTCCFYGCCCSIWIALLLLHLLHPPTLLTGFFLFDMKALRILP